MSEKETDLKTMLKKLSAGASYRKMIAASEAGMPICIATGVPTEVLFSMNVYPIWPESLAAISSGIGKAGEFFEEARDRGFSSSICSYVRCGLGISWLSKCAFGPIPEPHFFMSDVNLCCLHVNWWRYLEDHFKKPSFFMDMPAIMGRSDEEHLQYYENQIHEMIKFVEDNSKARFNMDSFKAAVSYSDLAGHYWKQIMELRKHKPSPASFRSLAGQILPLVTLLGDKDAADFYEFLYHFYTQEAQKGATPAQGGERFRLIWNGIPIWHHLQVINSFEERGANFVWEPYTSLNWGNKVPLGRLDLEKPFRTLAEKYTMVMSNLTIEQRAEYFCKAVEEYDVDGIVMFSNRSCRPMSIGQHEILDILKKKYDLPGLVFEGDQADAEGFSWEEAMGKINAFMEVLEGRKR